MNGRAKLWRRVCAACSMLDDRYAVITGEDEGEGSLASESWRCVSCGGAEAIAARRLEECDLIPPSTAACMDSAAGEPRPTEPIFLKPS